MAVVVTLALSLFAAGLYAKPIIPPSSLNPHGALWPRDTQTCNGAVGQDDTKVYGDYTGCVSSFPDGSGTKVRKDDTYHWDGGKCWTDLYYVNYDQNPVTRPWYELDNTCVDCGGTSTCSVQRQNATQVCTSSSFQAGVGVDFSILKDIIGISASVSDTETTEQCQSTTIQINCLWNDQLYHSVWAQNYYTSLNGYIRRRCNYKGDGLGDQTVWSYDYSVWIPNGNIVIGCDALCNDSSYPDPSTRPPPTTTTATPSSSSSPPPSPSSSASSDSCSWAGHCLGAACQTYDDCSDSLVCTNGVCSSS